MDLKTIRQLIRDGRSVVLVEEGEVPLVVAELQSPPPAEEVQISSRWPKARSVHDGPSSDPRAKQDHLLERLNQEILALKDQIAQQEELTGTDGNH